MLLLLVPVGPTVIMSIPELLVECKYLYPHAVVVVCLFDLVSHSFVLFGATMEAVADMLIHSMRGGQLSSPVCISSVYAVSVGVAQLLS